MNAEDTTRLDGQNLPNDHNHPTLAAGDAMKHLPMIGLIGATLMSGCTRMGVDHEVDKYIDELKRYVRIAADEHSGSQRSLSKSDMFVQDHGDTVLVMLLDKAPIEDVPIGGRFGIVYRVNKETGVVEKRIVQ